MERFARTRVALAVWDDEAKPALQAAWDAVEADDDVTRCESADHTARLAVVEAFAADTADVNHWDHVSHMTVADVRDLVGRVER